jgi:hypothetical protein
VLCVHWGAAWISGSADSVEKLGKRGGTRGDPRVSFDKATLASSWALGSPRNLALTAEWYTRAIGSC